MTTVASLTRLEDSGQRIATAFARLDERLVHTPYLRDRIASWLRHLSPTNDPADYFLQMRTLPILTFPEWVEEGLGVRIDPAFQKDVAYSTITGYCHIRLLDDVVDGDSAGDANLLPASYFFHSEFQHAYARWFAPEHPFWSHFTTLWFGAAEAAVLDTELPTITSPVFHDISARKVSPAKIPIVATCLHYERADVLPSWLDVCDRLGSIAQMTDDLFDWHDDIGHPERTTYFLSEAERRRDPGQPVAAWVLRQGFEWGVWTIQSWYRELRHVADGTGSQGLDAHLDSQQAALAERAAELLPGYRALASLADVWPQ